MNFRRVNSFALILLLWLIWLPGVIAVPQRAKQRASKFPISVAKIRSDVVGKTIEKVPNLDGTRTASWIFAQDELKEIDILSKRASGDTANVVINMRTGGSGVQLNGKLRLHYELIARSWELTKIENISFKFASLPDTSAFTNPAPLENGGNAQPRSFKLISSQFAVPPNYYHSVQFTIPTTTQGGRVFGRFRAVQGQNIKVHVVDSDGLENFRNRSQFLSYYSTGQVTVGTINLNLRPGLYYLVFENFYSTFSNKVVYADVDLEY